MAVAWQASGTLLGSTGADITPVIPTHQADDVLILHATARSNAVTLTTPSGWTPIAGPIDQGTTWRHYWFWRRATAPGTTNPLCDWSGTTGDKYGVVHVIRGAITTGTPIEASATTGGTASPGVATGVTSLTANALICSIGMSSDNTLSAVAATATNPASLTQRDFEAIPTGADAAMWISTDVRTAAGATGNVSHAWTGAQATWVILIVAIAEQAAAVTERTASGSGVPTGAGAALGLSPRTAAGSTVAVSLAQGFGYAVSPRFVLRKGAGSTLRGGDYLRGVVVAVAERSATGAATGTGTAAAVGLSPRTATGATSGVGTAAGLGLSQRTAAGSTAGVGTAAAVGVSPRTATGSASGTGTAAAVGLSGRTATGATAGTGAASPAIATTASGSATGTGAANAAGVSARTATGSAQGSGAAASALVVTASGSGTGIGTAGTDDAVERSASGAASGTGSASTVASWDRTAAGQAQGSGAATPALGVSASGSAAGSGTATIAVVVLAVGTAQGTGTAVPLVLNAIIYDVVSPVSATVTGRSRGVTVTRAGPGATVTNRRILVGVE